MTLITRVQLAGMRSLRRLAPIIRSGSKLPRALLGHMPRLKAGRPL